MTNSLKQNIGHNAFTLAEVLITLGIIGVVAALTIPMVVENYQKKATVSKLKKFYTNMNQVLTRAKYDYGDINSWTNSQDFYKNYVEPYVKNVDKVQYPIHVSGDFTFGLRFTFLDGTQAVLSASKGENYFTNNRVEIIFYINAKHYSDIKSLDIKNPSRERFYFVVNENGDMVPPNISRTRTQNLSNCNIRSTNFGNNGYIDCSTLIYKDGWKISDDYPW